MAATTVCSMNRRSIGCSLVVHTKKGTFRSVSDYFLIEIEELLLKNDLNDRFGWLYKSESKTAATAASNEVPVGSSRGIEPRSLD